MSQHYTKVPGFPIPDAPIYASLLVGNTLFVAGIFNNIGGVPRRSLAAIDMTTYAVLPFDAKLKNDSNIKALTYVNGKLYVGGYITEVNIGAVGVGIGYSVSNLVPLDPVGGGLDLSWGVRAFDGQVSTLTNDGVSVVFAGGQFTQIGTYTRFFAAAFTSNGVPTAWDPDASGPVAYLGFRPGGGGTVYMGGFFSQLHNHTTPVARNFAAKVGAVGAGGISPWDPHPNSPVETMLLETSSVLIGGLFTSMNNFAVPVDYISRVDDSLGVVIPGFALKSANPVITLAALDNYIYVTNFSAPQWNGAAYDPYFAGNFGNTRVDFNGNIDPGFRYDTGGPTYTITTYGGGGTGLTPKVFFGGEQNLVMGPISAVIVVITDFSGAVLHSEVGISQQVVGDITAVTMDKVNRVVYVGGSFQSIRGANGEFPRRGLAAFDLDTRNILPWAPELPSFETAWDLSYDNGVIYVVGNFNSAGPAGGPLVSRGRSAAFDPAGNMLPWDAKIESNSAFCLEVDGSFIYIGGTYNQVNGSPWPALGRFDKTTGALDATWTPTPVNGGGPLIYDLAFNEAGDAIYAAGQFTGIGGGGQARLGRVDLVTGADNGFSATFDAFTWSVMELAGKVYTGGSFITVNGQPRQGMAILDLAGALDPTVILSNGNSALVYKGTGFWARNQDTSGVTPRGFQTFSPGDTPSLVDPGLNGPAGASGFPSRAFADDGVGLLVVIGAFYRAGSSSGNFRELFVGPPPAATPQRPNVKFYLRKDNQTVLKWDQVFMDVNFNRVQVDGYRVYRSTNTNLETYALVKTITSLDVLGNVDTMFTENLPGFYAYQVTAFIGGLESEPVTAKQVNSPFGADFI